MALHFWLRHESKTHEKRTALTPRHAKALLDAGHRVTVEESDDRAFPIEGYQALGCPIAPQQSWVEKAPSDAVILGLKELDTDRFPLTHTHIHFAHVYKQQAGWKDFLNRFSGTGRLYDLEYLVNTEGRRVAAFGYWAGYAGAALAVETWLKQQDDRELGHVESHASQSELLSVLTKLSEGQKRPRHLRALVIGWRGRSGQGACDLLESQDFEVIGWERRHTEEGGPYPEILGFDVMINCVLVVKPLGPFLTTDLLKRPGNLSVITDVSCDPTGPHNPLPIYSKATTFDQPTLRLRQSPPLDVISIDHLPSLLPRESSEDFADQLLPHLLTLESNDPVWKRAEALFEKRRTEAKSS